MNFANSLHLWCTAAGWQVESFSTKKSSSLDDNLLVRKFFAGSVILKVSPHSLSLSGSGMLWWD